MGWFGFECFGISDNYNSGSIDKAVGSITSINSTQAILEMLEDNTNMTFVDKMLDHICTKHMRDSDVYKAAHIDRRLFSKIVCDRTYKPSKDTCIALSLALKLSLSDANDILSRAGYVLSHSNKRDVNRKNRSTAFTFMCGCLCAAQIFNVPITLPSYIILAFTVYILAVATPPIPGGAMAIFSLLMTQLGIPSAAMALLVALGPITDRISTATFITSLQMELVGISNSLDLLDKKKLRAKK